MYSYNATQLDKHMFIKFLVAELERLNVTISEYKQEAEKAFTE